jgi:hypothetical protein
MCFSSDFPSAEFLSRLGVRRVVLAQASGPSAENDIAATLATWKEGGLEIQLHRLDVGGLAPCKIGNSWGRALAQLFRRAILRPHPLGGFGATIPGHSSG